VIRIISAGVLGLLLAATGVAAAQAADDPEIKRQVATAPDAEDLAMERKVRNLALVIGNAYACTGKEGRARFKEESHHLFDLILQDVGSDLAFTYATSIGIGSTAPKEKLDCPMLLKKWEEIREDYELKGGE